MSHFYGTLQGARGQATRCGTASSGVTVHAAGWHGAIRVDVYVDDDGDDAYTVSLQPWKSSGGSLRLIARGKLDVREPRVEVMYDAG